MTSANPVSVVTSCLNNIITQDVEFALCLMNTGVFTIPSYRYIREGEREYDAITNFLQNDSTYLPSFDRIQTGDCRLLCTTPSPFGASSSCCQAASRVQACRSTNTKLMECKQMIQNGWNLSHHCSLSHENIGLITTLIIFLFISILMLILSKRYAHVQGERERSMGLEARLTITSDSIFTWWRQMTNLVWKNWVLRRRKPISMILELFLPVLLVTGLVFLANLDMIFGSNDAHDGNQAIITPSTLVLCTGIKKIKPTEMGIPTSTMKTFYTSGQSVIGMFLVLSYIKCIATTTTSMVYEKEIKIREIMKMMGLSSSILVVSWCLTFSIMCLPLTFLIAGELKYGNIFPSVEYATLVFLFWSFYMSMVAFSYCITPWFHKARTASIASVLIWLILYFPYFSVIAKTNRIKYWAALSPPTAFALAIDDIVRHAQLGTGIAYSIGIIQKPITVPSAFHMSWMLVFDMCYLFGLGWYFEQVIPQEYGIARPWNFILKPSFWFPSKYSTSIVRNERIPIMQSTSMDEVFSSPRNDSFYSPAIDGKTPTILRTDNSIEDNMVYLNTRSIEEMIEPVGPVLTAQETQGTCLQLRDLSKTFTTENGDKRAVQKLNLTFYSGQITALLGHNGAGKTTTISMLTGMIPPSEGDATLYHRSITRDFHQLRQIMGICPQHDVLYENLTVQEHLFFFGTMKQTSILLVQEQVEHIIQQVGLKEKRHARVKTLSGGQKRKLSVAIAFMGDSKLVFLDEPTSGMDPYSRRFTWQILKQYRQDRVIVLTTHFMDEADILGDRIAIMTDGQLSCVGRSLFLKQRYGTGYNLTLLHTKKCQIDHVTQFIYRYVPQAILLSHYGCELVFQLPSTSCSMFSILLHELDQVLKSLEIEQYGISVTTLEEVFLKIAQDRYDTKEKNTIISSIPTQDSNRWKQYQALFIKRLRITKRDYKSLINMVLIPFLFLFLLIFIPTIRVANFLPQYSPTLASLAQQENCTLVNRTIPILSDSQQEFCQTIEFDYCHLGIISCDPILCCTAQNVISPYYPCNTCTGISTTDACYNNQCLDQDGAKLQITLNAFLIAMIVTLAFSFIPAAMIAFLVREKNPIQNAKALQMICGAHISAYWYANAVYDVLIMMISILSACIILPLSSSAFSSFQEIMAMFFLLLTHGFVVIPLVYLASFHFHNHAIAQTSLLVFALCTGGLLSIFSFLCRIVDFDLTSALTLSSLDRNYLRWIFLFFPGYGLNNGLYEMMTRQVSRSSLFHSSRSLSSFSFFGWFPTSSCIECWDDRSNGCCIRHVFDLEVGGAPILYNVIETLVFIYCIRYLEYKQTKWKPISTSLSVPLDEDTDVAKERERVETSNDAIVIRHVQQQYPDGKMALKDLCLSISEGECFGYLGINGAGKSTTIKILTGQQVPTYGYVSLQGYDLAHSRVQARRLLGYCPQFDALHDLLTVTEQLELYAQLKGIETDMIPDAVETKIQEMGLQEYRETLTRRLSGGNKRKVSTAIALMGSPRIIILDEPSTGVDPSARRKMWDVITAVCSEKQSSVILTTHSMEECEALCTRVGILVSGQLQCLGSIQHLKQKYGQGYTVEVTVSGPDERMKQQIATRVETIMGKNIIYNSDLGPLSSALAISDLNGTWESLELDAFVEWVCQIQIERALIHFFQVEMPGSCLIEQQMDHYRFQIPKQSYKLAQIFELLEQAKQDLHVMEYSVSDTSLEHIFNQMASKQEEKEELETKYGY